MKRYFERYGIYYLIGVVILIGILVCFAAYRPAVGTDISGKNADWGNFGTFFWGFGTMCFSLLNAIIFYAIYQRLYRKQFFDTYRDVLDRLIINITDSKATRLGLINMIGVLGGMNNVSAYNTHVREGINHLIIKCSKYLENPNDNSLSELLGKLNAFQICLIANEYKGNFAPNAS